MSQKLKFHLKWIAPIVIIIIPLVLIVLSQIPRIISATVSPEVIVKGQNPEITVTVVVKPWLFIMPKLKAVMDEQGYQGSPKTQDDWTKFYSVFQLNPKILGALTKTGKDQQGNTIYQGSFIINNAITETVQIQPVNIFGLNLLPKTSPLLARLAITTRPATLPPDPGQAGKATLEGIDSDHDGLRDDIQREIFFLAPGSEKLRMAMRQEEKPDQDLASSFGLRRTEVDALLNQLFSGNACFDYLLAGDPSTYKTYSITKSYQRVADTIILSETVKNTPERVQASQSNYNQHGSGSTGVETLDRCSFNPTDYPD